MSLKALLNKQKIRIDDHNWGAGEVKSWDKKDKDVHIDKITKRKYRGKTQEILIKIPINSSRPIQVTAGGKKTSTIPRMLKKEIKDAFNDPITRNAFIQDLIPILQNYKSQLDSVKKASSSLNMIAKHFGLEWTEEQIVRWVEGSIKQVIQVYTDSQNKKYRASIDTRSIILNDDNRYK